MNASRVARRYAAALVSLVALVATVTFTEIVPARADPLASCTASTGTIVAVDFGHWHGPVVRGCALRAPSGYALLHAAGFTSAGDVHDGPGFVCRLGNAAFAGGTQYPTPSEEPCVLTPPTNAYWSFWTAPAGSSGWHYSSTGATNDVPHSGEVELWTFGGTNLTGTNGTAVPAIAPATLRVPAGASPTTAPPKPPATVAPKIAPTPASSIDSSATIAPRGNAGGSETTSRVTNPTVARGVNASATTSTTMKAVTDPPRGGSNAVVTKPLAGGSARVVAAKPISAASHPSSGSSSSLIVALVLLLLLGGGTAFAIRRRRMATR